MIDWIMNNIGTIIITAVLALVIVLIVVKLIRDKKNGRSSCGCGCSNCAMSEHCHPKDQQK